MKRRRWSWLFLATLGLLLGVYHNHRVHRGEPDLLTAFLRSLLLPLQRGARAATESTGELFATLARAREALREYDHLALENARLKRELEQLRAVAAENESLRQTLRLRSQLPHEWVGCRVIASYPQLGQQTLILDRGADDGILAGAPVVASEGLVGVVEHADAHTCTVRLLTAPRTAVSAKVLNAHKISVGVCEGRGDSTLLLNFIPPEAPLQAGDCVVTAGLGGKYPPNLPIGVVERVWIDRQYSVKKALVRPAVAFEQLRVALVQSQKSPSRRSQ
ncbi:MAG: rod shape-determining protein MreC [Fimbriimonadales bacterium]|nr:rod shape-determining protein MreC [Fimbriimonadales bacterium]